MQEMAPRFSKFFGGGGGGGGGFQSLRKQEMAPRFSNFFGGGGMPPDPLSKLPRCARTCFADYHTPNLF